LQHPNIVQIHEVGEHNGLPFFSLEFCEGGSLAAKLQGTPLTGEAAARLVKTLAGAVHAAHKRGIIHRDLKPGDVLLTADGTPKITDFGLAKKLDATGQTASGAVLGTPSYMAPEQAGGKSGAVGPACDVYVLGAILYECLTGRPPFKAATALDTLMQVLADEPVSPSRLQSKVPRDLETIWLKCLHKEARKRYATARALADDLRHFLNGEPIRARPVGRRERAVKWVKRNPLVAALAALMVLSVVGGAIGIFVKYRDAQEQAEAARKAKAVADEQRQRAIAERDRAEVLVYVSRISLAQQEWQYGDSTLAWRYLDSCPWNLRGWEHNYLYTQFSKKQRTLHSLKGHKQIVLCVAYSPDGKRFVSGGAGAANVPVEVKVWDADKGIEILSLKGQTGEVYSVAYSPDGKRIVSAGSDKMLKVWDADAGGVVLSLKGHPNEIAGFSRAAFSPDSKHIVSTEAFGTLTMWDANTGAELFSLKAHSQCYNVAFSPDGKRIVSGGADGTLKVWDAGTGAELLSLEGETKSIGGLAYSPDGKRIVSGSGNNGQLAGGRDVQPGPGMAGELKVWDADTGVELLSPKGHTHAVKGVAYSPDGKRIVSASWDHTVKMWDARTGTETLTLKGHTNRVSAVAFSPNGKRILTGSWDKTLMVWDADKSARVYPLEGHSTFVSSVAFSPDGKHIVSGAGFFPMGTSSGGAKVWDADRGKEELTLKDSGGVFGIAYSPDGKHIVGATWGFTPKVWDADTGAEGRSLKTEREEKSLFGIPLGGSDGGPITCVAYSPDGKRIAGMHRVWDAATGSIVRTLGISGKGSLTSVAFSPDGTRIVSATAEVDQGGLTFKRIGDLKVWDVGTGQQLLSLKGHTCAAFSPDGKHIASAGQDNTLKVWDADTGAEVLSLKGHTDGVSSVAYRPDGQRMVSGSVDGTLKVWDANTGVEIDSLKVHTDRVTGVAYSPDGKRIVSGCRDGRVKVWIP
jgi:WD40 repeat protein